MFMEFNVNHPILFLLAGIIVLAVLGQSLYFLRKAWRRAKEIGMPMLALEGDCMDASIDPCSTTTKIASFVESLNLKKYGNLFGRV